MEKNERKEIYEIRRRVWRKKTHDDNKDIHNMKESQNCDLMMRMGGSSFHEGENEILGNTHIKVCTSCTSSRLFDRVFDLSRWFPLTFHFYSDLFIRTSSIVYSVCGSSNDNICHVCICVRIEYILFPRGRDNINMYV